MADPPSAIEAAKHAGIDLGLIDDNLHLSPGQPALQHQAALDLALQVERAGRRLRGRLAKVAE